MASGPVVFWTAREMEAWLRSSCPTLSDTKIHLLHNVMGPQLLSTSKEEIEALGIDDEGDKETLLGAIDDLRKVDERGAFILAMKAMKDESSSLCTSFQEGASEIDLFEEDQVFAFKCFMLETEDVQRSLQDELVALRMDKDTLEAQRLQVQFLAMKEQEERDRAYAERLSGRAWSRPPQAECSSEEAAAVLETFAGLSLADLEEEAKRSLIPKEENLPHPSPVKSAGSAAAADIFVGESSRMGAGSIKGKGVMMEYARANEVQAECNVCFTWSPRMYHVACGHSYCQDCLGELFRQASKDETLLPVRCCKKPIDPTIVRDVLSPKEAELFTEKLHEYSAVNKMYCPVPRCSKFIDLDMPLVDHNRTTGQFLCPSCNAGLCANCKAEWHSGYTCREFKALPGHMQNAIDLTSIQFAQKEGWQRCSQCGYFVSLSSGCNHMTCRCGHEFCYECAARWKSCGCESWHEPLLFEESARRIAIEERRRPANALPMTSAERDAAINRMVEHVRNHHECNHIWTKANAYYDTCDNCSYILNHYGYRCRGNCAQIVCHTCRFHRMR